MTTLHPVYPESERDIAWLWKLLKERKPEQNISHDGHPVWEKHIAFVKSRPYPVWNIVYSGDLRVGMIYLTKQGEIGLHIAEKYARQGHGRAAVAELMRRYPMKRYLANVAPGNAASHAFWQAYATARVIQHTYQLDGGELK